MSRFAVYAGSFDPITNGHLAIVEAAAKTFDKLYFIITANPEKRTGRFDPFDRETMAKEALAHLPNVEVVRMHGRYVVDWAKQHDCGWMVRGLRGSADLDAERVIEKVNASIVPEVQTLYFPAPLAVENVSSSLVMGLVGHTGWLTVVRPLVPDSVFMALVDKHVKGIYDKLVGEEYNRSWSWFSGCYNRPGKYHNLLHIAEMLDLLDRYAPDCSKEVRVAALFHDLINGEGPEDEARSANGAKARDGTNLELVAQYIRATAKCGLNKDFDKDPQNAGLLVDADMAILGAPRARYLEYTRGIRREYEQYPIEQYQVGRLHFLKGLLSREWIFYTDAFRFEFEARAGANIRWEIKRIESSLRVDQAS